MTYSSSTVTNSSLIKDLYTPKSVIDHAALLLQTFVHWGRFSTAASRRSLDSVSVPVRRVMLSHPLHVVALVGFYPTNKLMCRRLLSIRRNFTWERLMSPHVYQVLFQISPGYPWDRGRLPTCYSPVCHASKLAFDLHALDMPPAFTLSQDQTLSKNLDKSRLYRIWVSRTQYWNVFY